MLSTQEIYNFLLRADAQSGDLDPSAPPALPGPPDAGQIPMPAPNFIPSEEDRIDGLRTRLQALIGPPVKKMAADNTENTVFGDTVGELDPDADELDPEWEEILELITQESPTSVEPTASLRPPKKSISR